jgi:hypothetical protein
VGLSGIGEENESNDCIAFAEGMDFHKFYFDNGVQTFLKTSKNMIIY